MSHRLIISIVGLIAAVLITPAWGFDVLRAKTEAEILPPNLVTPVIQLNFKADLSNNGFADLPNVDTVINWSSLLPNPIAPPNPLQVLIPAGCFEANDGFHVRDFRACGVQMTVDFGRGVIPLSIMDFEAKLKTRRDGTNRLVVEVSFTDRDREHAILGILGGATVEIMIGTDTGTALPTAVEMVSAPRSPI